MTQLATIAQPRAVPFTATRFDAFKVSETGRTYALGKVEAATPGAAMNAALAEFALHHKEHLLIRETGPSGILLRIYAIKRKSNARYVHKDHVTRAVHDLYAAPVCTIDGGVL